MSFEWQTEEAKDWEEHHWQEEPKKPERRKGSWRIFLLVAVLIAAAGFLLRQQISRRLEATTAAIESDIFASHNLLGRAAANQDGQLGKTILSGRDKSWSLVQTELISSGIIFENPGLYLMLPAEPDAFDPLSPEDDRFIDLTLNPELSEAELSYTREYEALTNEGVEIVTLQQTAVYRQGKTRWLFAPPLETFWGEWLTTAMDDITFIYPTRDEQVVGRLAEDLHSLVNDTCGAMPELNCAESGPIQVRFDTNPESLLEAADPANLYDDNLRLNLPTPTLIGLPLDNDGYEALRNAYSAQLVSALFAQGAAYECCFHAPFFQAIMVYQLSELDLVSWPVTIEDHSRLAAGGVFLESLIPLWNSTEFELLQNEDSWRLFSFIEFLFRRHLTEETPFSFMAQINTRRAFQSWLMNFSGSIAFDSFSPSESISRNWWFYALLESEMSGSVAEPLAWPEQNLQVICLDSGRENLGLSTPEMNLNRYDLASEDWREELNIPGIGFFNPLPQDDGVVLQLIESGQEQTWLTILWRDETGVDVLASEDAFSISLGQVDPYGRFLLSYSEIEDQPVSNLVDVESCEMGECRSTPLDYTPYWSPDGEQVLLTDFTLFESGQYLVDGRVVVLSPGGLISERPILMAPSGGPVEAAEVVGQGASPFWLTNELFGFIKEIPGGESPFAQGVVVMAADDLAGQTILQTVDLLPLLPEAVQTRTNPPIMRYAIAHPIDSNLVFIMATVPANGQRGYVYRFDRRTETLDLLFQLNLEWVGHALGFSPDGRFLAATGSWQPDNRLPNQNAPFGSLHLYDLARDEQQTFITNNEVILPAFTFDWSSDGRWLAFLRSKNAIGLLAPAEGFQRTLVHDKGDCSSLAWINPLPAE